MRLTKIQELTGSALDWAVAKCWYGDEYDLSIPSFDDGLIFAPSTNWLHGGPIIERENITLTARTCERDWVADIGMNYEAEGPAPLIAAMRCYVASKLGNEVEIPESL